MIRPSAATRVQVIVTWPDSRRRLVGWQCQGVWSLQRLAIGIALFTLVGWSGVDLAESMAHSAGLTRADLTLWDGVLLAFAGPARGVPLITVTGWLVIHLTFAYAVGDLAYGGLARQGALLLPRVGSRHGWWGATVTSLSLLAVGYAAIGIGVVCLIAGMRFGWSESTSTLLRLGVSLPLQQLGPLALLSIVFVLLAGTLSALAVAQSALALLARGSIYGFALIALVLIFSWLLGEQRALLPWLPGTHSALLRQTRFDPSVPELTFLWSCAYNLALILLGSMVGWWRLRHYDVVAATAAEAQ